MLFIFDIEVTEHNLRFLFQDQNLKDTWRKKPVLFWSLHPKAHSLESQMKWQIWAHKPEKCTELGYGGNAFVSSNEHMLTNRISVATQNWESFLNSTGVQVWSGNETFQNAVWHLQRGSSVFPLGRSFVHPFPSLSLGPWRCIGPSLCPSLLGSDVMQGSSHPVQFSQITMWPGGLLCHELSLGPSCWQCEAVMRTPFPLCRLGTSPSDNQERNYAKATSESLYKCHSCHSARFLKINMALNSAATSC